MFVGEVMYGGRHRNHCPFCLHSRHVDGRTPGDRASDCGSSMAPIGVFARPGGEQVVLHRCLGCGFERHNRVAADDDASVIMRLPVVRARLGGRRDTAAAERTA
jgi:RNHCP domain-containing protein